MMNTIPAYLEPFETPCQLLNMGFIYAGTNTKLQHVFRVWYSFDGEARQVHVLITLNHDFTDAQYLLKYIRDWDAIKFAVVDQMGVLNKLIELGFAPAIAVRRLLKIDNLFL